MQSQASQRPLIQVTSDIQEMINFIKGHHGITAWPVPKGIAIECDVVYPSGKTVREVEVVKPNWVAVKNALGY